MRVGAVGKLGFGCVDGIVVVVVIAGRVGAVVVATVVCEVDRRAGGFLGCFPRRGWFVKRRWRFGASGLGGRGG